MGTKSGDFAQHPKNNYVCYKKHFAELGGFGVNAIAGNYLGNDNELNSDSYLGTFNYISGNTPVAGISYFSGNNFNDVELWPGNARIWRGSSYKQIWSGVSISAPGPNASATIGSSQYIYIHHYLTKYYKKADYKNENKNENKNETIKNYYYIYYNWCYYFN